MVIRNMDVKMVGTSFFRRISVHSVCSVAFGHDPVTFTSNWNLIF